MKGHIVINEPMIHWQGFIPPHWRPRAEFFRTSTSGPVFEAPLCHHHLPTMAFLGLFQKTLISLPCVNVSDDDTIGC